MKKGSKCSRKKEDKADKPQSLEDKLDEALAESFPASDPASPSAPGSISKPEKT
jgi:hypothetical protein